MKSNLIKAKWHVTFVTYYS